MDFATRNMVVSRTAWISVLWTLGSMPVAALANASDHTTAERLVRQAQQAELEGDPARRFALLRQAVRIAPDFELARWQLGQVQVDGQWLAVEEAQRRAAADPHQGEYRERRAQYGETPLGQLELARWCRKNNLDEEARFHWASVLSVDPNHEEALRAMDMRWHNGQLLTHDEIAEQKDELRESKRAAKKWKSTVARWRREVSGSDAAKREAALEEIRSLSDADAIFAIEELTLGRDTSREEASDDYCDISLALVEALGNMPEHDATLSMVRHAVWSPSEDVRETAIESIKKRPQHDYVPILLSGLAMPIESSFQVRTQPDGSVHYTHSLYREGPEVDWSTDARLSAMQYDLGGRQTIWDAATRRLEIGPRTGSTPDAMRRKAAVASRYHNRFGNTAAQTELQVWQANITTELLNARIFPVLTGATGEKIGENPTAWWDWWRNRNEYYAPEEKDVDRRYVAHTHSYYYGFPSHQVRYPPPPIRQFSCFAKGTPVWTKTGQRPIESLELGELVLSQNVNTGELAYQPVIGRTVRPPSPIVKLSFGGEELRTTLGHPLWVAGVGWRMAKELGDGAILHAVTGSPRVESITPDGEEEAYNLVVAESNTYFVGECGILVHDNTPRTPTRATVPGLVTR